MNAKRSSPARMAVRTPASLASRAPGRPRLWLPLAATALLLLGLIAATPRAAAAAPQAAATTPAAVPGEERRRVAVNPGESVMTLIRRTLPNSPYRDEVLRKALFQMNPEAYAPGSQTRLKPGAVVVVPGPADLQRIAFGEVAPAAVAPAAPATVSAPRPELERRNWVRYP